MDLLRQRVKGSCAIRAELDGDCLVCVSHKPNDKGYCKIGIGGKLIAMHRYVYMMKYGDIPDGMVIRHSCDNRACINIEHLLMGTSQDNVNDMVDRNRQSRGEGRPNAKLTDSLVREIRELGSDNPKLKQKDIAIMYGVKDSVISNIINRKTWKHV